MTPGVSQNLLTAVASWEQRGKQYKKRIASSVRPGPGLWPDNRHFAHNRHFAQLDCTGGGMDTARAARRPAGVPAQTTVPPSRRRGSDRIQLRTVLHVLFCNLIFLLIFYKNFTTSSIF